MAGRTSLAARPFPAIIGRWPAPSPSCARRPGSLRPVSRAPGSSSRLGGHRSRTRRDDPYPLYERSAPPTARRPGRQPGHRQPRRSATGCCATAASASAARAPSRARRRHRPRLPRHEPARPHPAAPARRAGVQPEADGRLPPADREDRRRQLLDDAAAKGRFDLIRDFATPLPVAVITTLLGIDGADTDALARHGTTSAPRWTASGRSGTPAL